jgi:hypothetical protein
LISKHIGIMLCIITMVSVSFAGCVGQTPGSSTVPVAQPTVTTHPTAIVRTTVPTKFPSTATVTQTLTINPAAASPASGFSFQPESQITADDLFRIYLSDAMTKRSGTLAYQNTYTSQLTNISPQNPRGSQTSDSTDSCKSTLKSTNEPGTYQGSPAMHYTETLKGDGNGPCIQDTVWDVYYDKNTSMMLGGVGYNTGDAGSRWTFHAGQPLADLSGFYSYDDNGNLEPNMIMGQSYGLTGKEKVTFNRNETVTVPAGTFSGASHFTEKETNCYYMPCTTATWQYWATPGVPGFVKIQYDIDGPDEIYPLVNTHLNVDTELTGWG